MKKPIALALVAALAAASAPIAPASSAEAPSSPLTAFEVEWIVKRSDNVCGLRNGKQLSNPAVINYGRCLAATPEYKKMKDDGIKPESPEGIRLRSAASNRVRKAANTVRKAGGYCSVWKAVSHKDGRRIADLTTRVVGQY